MTEHEMKNKDVMQFHIESKHVERECVYRSGRDSDAHGELTDENNGCSGPSKASHPQHPPQNKPKSHSHTAPSCFIDPSQIHKFDRSALILEILGRFVFRSMVETTPRRPPEIFENTHDFTDEVHAEIHDDTYAETFADIHAEIHDSGFVFNSGRCFSACVTGHNCHTSRCARRHRSKVEC